MKRNLFAILLIVTMTLVAGGCNSSTPVTAQTVSQDIAVTDDVVASIDAAVQTIHSEPPGTPKYQAALDAITSGANALKAKTDPATQPASATPSGGS